MLLWDDIQTRAKTDGDLVYAMDQGQTPVLKDISKGDHSAPKHVEEIAPGPWGVSAPAGFCVGLAMRWIGLRFNGKDYPYNRKTQVADGLFWEATRDQNISRDTTGDWPTRLETVLRPYGATVNRGQSSKKPVGVTIDLLLKTISAGDGLYYFELRGPPPHAHALAIQPAGETYHLFDGNEGHFLVKTAVRFEYFLTRFFKNPYVAYRTKYPNETWTAVVNARR